MRTNHPNSIVGIERSRVIPWLLSLPPSAVLMAYAIASPDHWWLGWVTLLPLFAVIQRCSPQAAACFAASWGAGVFSFSLLFGDTTLTPSVLSLATLTLVPAGYAWFGAKLTRQIGFSPYLLALGWMGVEFALRPVGLKHGLLASTQGDGLLLGALGSFSGYVLVAFLVAYVNAALLTVLGRIPLSNSGSRYLRRTANTPKRHFVLDVPSFLHHVARPAQPRAPPRLA